ncbi:CpcT/CpeT family chromophore lyase [Aerosakkonemataceae cyanobacterium BLCC-F50]|uniref:CpcT/CpeT family chromophore lyase n=1 Tax=Floridaenema flaviceps BLCC-F50 TaxID=3153642 RepID=A0ABV4XUM1_9CYAN
MKQRQSVTAIFFLFGFLVPQQADAALIPSVSEQVAQVTQWFTGDFNNAEQVSQNPSVPLITLSTCQVQLLNSIEPNGTKSLYLEQPALNRFRLYSFTPENDAVNLSIRSFINPGSLKGICEQPLVNRVVSQNNLLNGVCNLMVFWEPNRYIGSNAPTGCPTSTGGKVVSDVTFGPDSIISLDRIFSSTGQLIVATPIQFLRVKSVPEPTMLAGLAIAGFGLTWLRRKQ